MAEEKRRNEASSPATTASSSSSSNSVYIRSKKARITNMSDGAISFFIGCLREDEIMYDAVLEEVWQQVQAEETPRIPRRRMHTSNHTGEIWMNEILTGHEKSCYDIFRVHPSVFVQLRDMLVDRSLISDSRYVSATQQLAMFLYTVGHGLKTGSLMHHFQHSSQTISHYVNKVAVALSSLKEEYIVQPTNVHQTHPYIAGNARFFPYFKDALGAIDGTHIPANVPIEDHARFRNRKQQISQNVMAVVSFDGLFQYACVGWEGSAPDMKVLRWAVTRKELVVSSGKYYLVDSGYANTNAFIAPYRGQRYHISSFRGRRNDPYANKDEKFNHRHAQLRNCVERAFGVLKMRFKILQQANKYPFKTQKEMVFACMVLHNFIRREFGYDAIYNGGVDAHLVDAGNEEVPDHGLNLNAASVAAGRAVRDAIADQLWAVGNGR